MRKRSTLIGLASGLSVAALLLSGCASTPADSDEPVELRFAWWGGDKRAELTQQVIDLFEEANPNITVEGEFADFGTYWPRLAISVAAGDAPDIMQFEEQFLREYSSRGALADLSALEIDTSDYDEAVLTTGTTDEGLVSLSAGVITPAIVANPALFETAGVEMPDDSNWTWDDYAEIGEQISASNPGVVWGSEQLMFETSLLNVFSRQNDEATYSEDGTMGISADLLTELWQMVLDNQKSGSTTPADVSVEEITKPLEQSGTATGTLGMGEWYSHNLGVLEGAAGQELTLLRMPGAANAEGSEYLKSSMSWSISATSEHPEEAALFVDFISNNPEAQKILGTERGLPANLSAREVITDALSDADKQGLAMIEKISEVASAPPILPPVGSGALQAIMQRYTTDVLFERITPAEAAEQFLAEANATLGG
jgi:multiple sugar transport system substrate-binding protein